MTEPPTFNRRRLPQRDMVPRLQPQAADVDYLQADWEEIPTCSPSSEDFGRQLGFIGFGSVLALALGVYVAFATEVLEREVQEEMPSPIQPPPAESFENPQVVDRIWEAVTGYLLSDTVEERAFWVRQSERTLPLMEQFYQRHRFQSQTVVDLDLVLRQKMGEFEYYVTKVHTLEGEGGTFLLFDYGNRCVVDWQTRVGFNPLTWADLREQRPDEPTKVRAYARVVNYYNHAYDSRRDYLCVALRAPQGDDVLYGYLDRESLGNEALLTYLQSSSDEKPLVVELRFEPHSDSADQVHLTRFVHAHWLSLPAS